MARRAVKKTPRKPSKKEFPVTAVTPTSPSDPGKPGSGVSFGKFLILVLVVLGILYGPGLFKNPKTTFQGGLSNEFKPKPKYFLVKKVLQFTGTEKLGKPMFVNDLVVAAPNRIALVDNIGNQVVIFDNKGKLIRKWGKGGNGPMEFSEPSGIAADHKGHIFVLDTWNSAVKTFNLNGVPSKPLDLTHYGFFYGPRRLGWDGANFLVSNAANFRLARLTPKGDLLNVFAGKGTGKGEFTGVSSAIADGKGHIYVGDINDKDSRVQVFDESGKVVQVIKTDVPPDDIALDSKGRLFVGCGGNASKVFDAQGNWLGDLADEAEVDLPLKGVLGIDMISDDMILTGGGDFVTIYQVVGEKTDAAAPPPKDQK